jgi:hypothetical protein
MITPESFLLETKQLCDEYIKHAAENDHFLFTSKQGVEYRHWLFHPKRPVPGDTAKEQQNARNTRTKALASYELDHGRLWRCATEEEPCWMVLCTKDIFEHLAEVHFELEHAAVKKTLHSRSRAVLWHSQNEMWGSSS